jgi:hypothetical protein
MLGQERYARTQRFWFISFDGCGSFSRAGQIRKFWACDSAELTSELTLVIQYGNLVLPRLVNRVQRFQRQPSAAGLRWPQNSVTWRRSVS